MTQKTASAPYRMRIIGSEIRVEQPKEFGVSFFREEYESILRAVRKVIESSEADCRQRDNAKRYPDIRIHNIVPIIGPRGSGKSSILHTVASILGDGDMLDQMKGFLPSVFDAEKSFFRGRSFFVAENIDGSLLEPHEDIFLTILAQMNQMLPKGTNTNEEQFSGQRYTLRELKKKLEELYGNARQMEERPSSYRREEISDLNALNRLSDSLRLRQDFRKLLNQFLEFLSFDNYSNEYQYGRAYGKQVAAKNCYLVIPIDDLDLNVDHGYRMLEKLHRYLMLPNVIILMAFDQEQFKRLCEFYFYRMIPKYDSRMNAAASDIDLLARQYLEKVMPLNLRTYVPKLLARSDVKLEFIGSQEKESYLPKHLAFKLLYEKLGMRMDTDGGKPHFLERDSLRSFVNSLNLLRGLVSPFSDSGKGVAFDKDISRHNHRIMYQEITQNMATSWLSDTVALTQYRVDNATTVSTYTYQLFSPKELFKRNIEVVNPIPRAFLKFFNDILYEGRLAPENSMLRHLADSSVYYDFSYGEILHIIYHFGRINADNKRLIHCLIAYYSLAMNRSYLNLRHQQRSEWQKWDAEHRNYQIGGPLQMGNQKEENPHRREFLELMNGSVSGSWANSMVPQIRLYGKNYGAGFRIVTDMGKAFIIPNTIIEDYFKNNQSEDEKKIKCFFRAMLIIGMLFDRPNYKLPETFNFGTRDYPEREKLEKLILEVSPYSDLYSSFRPITGKGTFGFLNFVSSAFQYYEYIGKLLDYLVGYTQYNKGLFCLQDNDKIGDYIIDVKSGIQKDFEDWDRASCSFAMPLYDLDVYYNLVKRLLQDRYGKPEYNDGTEILLDSYLDIYRAVARRLNSNDQTYLNDCHVSFGIDKLRPLYAEAFCECPFIKWLGIQQDGSIISESTEAYEGKDCILYTTKLTSTLLAQVFDNLTLRSAVVSICHKDGFEYERTAGYDD